MGAIKKSIIPFLLVMLVVFIMMDFGDGEIKYEQVGFESIPVEYREKFSMSGPGGTGMYQGKDNTYAFIAVKPDEKVEILFVGDAEDGVGHEVKYKVVGGQNVDETKVIKGLHGDFTYCLLRLEKVVNTPFGFRNVDL
jgi:hypothetical protein